MTLLLEWEGYLMLGIASPARKRLDYCSVARRVVSTNARDSLTTLPLAGLAFALGIDEAS